MLKFLKRSPLRVLAVILFMVVTFPSQKALGAEMAFEEADAYLQKVMNGEETFDEKEVLKAAKVISAHFAQKNEPQVTVPNILSSVFLSYVRSSLPNPQNHHFLKTYRNTQGKGFLHLLRDLGGIPEFLHYTYEWYEILSDMLKTKDDQGKTPLDGVFVDEGVFESLKRIDPNLLVTPTGPDNITPLMALALSFEEMWVKDKKQRYEQCKSQLPAINTTDANHLAALSSEEISRMVGEKLTLNDQIWKDIPKNIYSKLRWREFSHRQFALNALYIAAGTDARPPLFQSFWQQNTNKSQEANKLWEGYFSEKDRLWEKDLDYSDPTNILERDNPLRIRALNEVLRQEELELAIKQTALKNMISTGGTFGINFKRTAKDLDSEEIFAVLNAIQSYVNTIYAVKDEELGGKKYTDLRKSLRWMFNEEEKKQTMKEFLQSNFDYTVQSTKSADELLEEYVDPAEKRILPNIVEKVTAQIRDDLIPSTEKLAGFTLDQKTKLANHQITCAVLAAHHLLEIAPSGCAERINSDIDRFLQQSAISLGQKEIKIKGINSESKVDRDERLRTFYHLIDEKYPEYEQKMETLRTQQAAARQERERDDLY